IPRFQKGYTSSGLIQWMTFKIPNVTPNPSRGVNVQTLMNFRVKGWRNVAVGVTSSLNVWMARMAMAESCTYGAGNRSMDAAIKNVAVTMDISAAETVPRGMISLLVVLITPRPNTTAPKPNSGANSTRPI